MELKNKLVLVTGSSSGIGKAVALRFAREGANVVVHYHVNKKGGQEVLKEIQEMGVRSELVQADISSSKDIKELFKSVGKSFKSIDILVNNAAIGTDLKPFMEAEFEDVVRIINTDLIGPMMCAREAAKIMQEQGFGKIINTSSIRGADYGGRAVAYAAAKAGINSFTKTFAKLVAPNIQVNAVAPGFVKTRSYDKMSQEKINDFINQTYLKRWITTEEIADAFVFLAKNDGLTGQVIYVDGGFTLK